MALGLFLCCCKYCVWDFFCFCFSTDIIFKYLSLGNCLKCELYDMLGLGNVGDT